MSTRERWIVYPLLFLTFGIALRDKIIPPAHSGNLAMQFVAEEIFAQRIHCNTLFVDGLKGRPVIIAGIDAKTGAGAILTQTPDGFPQVRLYSTETGGRIIAYELKKPPQSPINPALPDTSSSKPSASKNPKSPEKKESGK
jgi:hypothetical protein